MSFRLSWDVSCGCFLLRVSYEENGKELMMFWEMNVDPSSHHHHHVAMFHMPMIIMVYGFPDNPFPIWGSCGRAFLKVIAFEEFSSSSADFDWFSPWLRMCCYWIWALCEGISTLLTTYSGWTKKDESSPLYVWAWSRSATTGGDRQRFVGPRAKNF